MKCWTCTDFKGHWPVGAAAVVIAHDEEEAAKLINDALRARGLSEEITPEQLDRLSMGSPRAVILCDGNY